MGYLGAKSGHGAYQTIIASMPPHDTYIEAFYGSGVIMRQKAPALRNIAIDKDDSVFSKFAPPPSVETVVDDAIAYLAKFDYASSGKTLVYCDPPYLPEVRTSRHRYKFEMTKRDHLRLLSLIRTLPCSIVISGYASSLYDTILSDWRRKEFQVMTRGGVRTEVIWMNFSDQTRLLSNFVGDGWIDRQRIRRKSMRWAKKFSSMPVEERNLILASMLAILD
jgi:DNA adenine methylase